MLKRSCPVTLIFITLAFVLLVTPCAVAQEQERTTLAPNENGETESVPAPVFEKKRLQRMYDEVLGKLQNLEFDDGAETYADDWFVVGGMVRGQASFRQFQGEENVAKRIVEFVDENKNRCEWRVYVRAYDEQDATQMVSKVQTDYQKRKIQQARAQRQQQIARQRQQIARSRAASSGGGRRSSGGRRTTSRGGGGGC